MLIQLSRKLKLYLVSSMLLFAKLSFAQSTVQASANEQGDQRTGHRFLLHDAGEAMYQAKEAGRNRVIAAS